MNDTQITRVQAAIELLDYMMRREIHGEDDKYKYSASLSLEQVNEVLLVAGVEPIVVADLMEAKNDNK